MCNILIGLTSPYTFEIPSYLKYDITKFKDNIRFIEIVVNRDGTSNGIVALYFDGATCTFRELPQPEKVSELTEVLNYIRRRDNNKVERNGIMLFNYAEKHNKFITKLIRKLSYLM